MLIPLAVWYPQRLGAGAQFDDLSRAELHAQVDLMLGLHAGPASEAMAYYRDCDRRSRAATLAAMRAGRSR